MERFTLPLAANVVVKCGETYHPVAVLGWTGLDRVENIEQQKEPLESVGIGWNAMTFCWKFLEFQTFHAKSHPSTVLQPVTSTFGHFGPKAMTPNCFGDNKALLDSKAWGSGG